ncbi:MAG: P-type Ca2+ transporter type [Peptostreptococcaceae bacterium]|nr:P-type Ca2+ transporter type [Peptostreptococcaceae bacterium]
MWFTKEIQDVLKEYDSNEVTGLSSQEVKLRLEKYGENKLKSKPKKSFFHLFLSQLKDMLIYVLLGAAAITLFIGEYVDAVIILLVVILNAVIGVVQEYKAEKAVEALQKLSNPKALVKRDGQTLEIQALELVPGDIVILDAGRFVPADLRLIDSANLQIEESTLTGESVPSEKNAFEVFSSLKTPIGDQSNMAFMSTIVTYGRGEGIVVATGMNTEIGKIAQILDEDTNELTPLQVRLEELGKTLGYIAIGICILIFAISLIQKRDLFEMFLTAISLAVAAIPEGLPAIVAIVLAIGVTRMSKINAIVKKLPAVETLGSVNIICSDKTGTLTQNKMKVMKYYTLDNLNEVDDNNEINNPDSIKLVQGMILSSDATYENNEGTGDPTEIALVQLGHYYGILKSKLNETYPRVGEKPFDSDRKLMSTLVKSNDKFLVYTKGALDSLLKISTHVIKDGKSIPLTENHKSEFIKTSEELSNKALRILALAYKEVETEISSDEMENDLTLIGIVGMMDPPRPEVKSSIETAKKAGITPIMITGDHKTTAFAIAKELGIADDISQAITGTEIDEYTDEEFSKLINKIKVFARVSPEHKVKIVKAFKSQGNIVSMTGDGVNDAPSLKTADIGVAMGITGTDVSKGASDMILTDDNFTTIVHAIEEGRNIYNNIKKSVVFLLSCNLGEVVTILLSILFFWPVPLLPTQILWINLITDTLPAISLGMDPGDKDVMNKKPRNPKESFFAHGAGLRAIMGGILIGLLTLGAFFYGLYEHGYSLGSRNIPEDVLTYARTMAFVVLAASQLFYSLAMRNPTKSIFQIGIFSNLYLIGAIIIGFILQFSVISIPFLANAFKVHNISIRDWGLVILFALIPLMINEIVKIFLRKREARI